MQSVTSHPGPESSTPVFFLPHAGPHHLSILLAHPLVRALTHVPVRPSVHYLPPLCILCRLPSRCVHAWPRSHRVPHKFALKCTKDAVHKHFTPQPLNLDPSALLQRGPWSRARLLDGDPLTLRRRLPRKARSLRERGGQQTLNPLVCSHPEVYGRVLAMVGVLVEGAEAEKRGSTGARVSGQKASR